MPTATFDATLVSELHARLVARFGTLAPSRDELEVALLSLLEASTAAWPALEPDAPAYLAHATDRLPDDLAPLEALRSLRAGELYLAWSCARGDALALRAFEQAFGPVLLRAAEKARRSDTPDVLQLVRERLFVGPAPRIAGYAGHGSLGGWLHVATARLVLDLARKKTEVPSPEDPERALAVPSPEDPEAEYLRQLYGNEFRAAFERAAAELTPSDRNTLRYYHVLGLTIDQLAAARGVHRATAARQVQRARETLSSGVREQLAQRLRLGETELASVMRVLGSDVHVSVRRVLDAQLEPPGAAETE